MAAKPTEGKKPRGKTITTFRLEGLDRKTKEIMPVVVAGNTFICDTEKDCALIKRLIQDTAPKLAAEFERFYATKIVTRVEPGYNDLPRREL